MACVVWIILLVISFFITVGLAVWVFILLNRRCYIPPAPVCPVCPSCLPNLVGGVFNIYGFTSTQNVLSRTNLLSQGTIDPTSQIANVSAGPTDTDLFITPTVSTTVPAAQQWTFEAVNSSGFLIRNVGSQNYINTNGSIGGILLASVGNTRQITFNVVALPTPNLYILISGASSYLEVATSTVANTKLIKDETVVIPSINVTSPPTSYWLIVPVST